MAAKFGFQVTVNDRTIWLFPEDVDAALQAAKKRAVTGAKTVTRSGIAYGWTRAPGDDPISLGTFNDLTVFIDNQIIANLPEPVRPAFSVQKTFDDLIENLPNPVDEKLNDLKTKAVFELDGLRLKIPGRGASEKMQFELGMMINLIELDLELGPFQLNRLYAKLGNFT